MQKYMKVKRKWLARRGAGGGAVPLSAGCGFGPEPGLVGSSACWHPADADSLEIPVYPAKPLLSSPKTGGCCLVPGSAPWTWVRTEDQTESTTPQGFKGLLQNSKPQSGDNENLSKGSLDCL